MNIYAKTWHTCFIRPPQAVDEILLFVFSTKSLDLLRARRFPHEKVVKQTRVGVLGSYSYDLETEEGIYSQDPYFEVPEQNMQTNKNPELSSPVFPFVGLNNLLPLTGMKFVAEFFTMRFFLSV